MDYRRELLLSFRQRLGRLLRDEPASRVALAQALGVDRSTLTELSSPRNRRLPRVETLVALARHANVSVDWLLGLAPDEPGRADVVHEELAFERDVISPDDERLIGWLLEARDSKIRYVPTTLPDVLKTQEVIRFEVAGSDLSKPEHKIETAATRLAWQRKPEADLECCSSMQAVESFARGEGIWRTMPAADRLRQLNTMADLVEELYPAFRWFLFDGRTRYGAPVTVFGTRRAALYVGQMYLVFTAPTQVRIMAQHFDQLIRAARVQPPEIAAFVRRLRTHAR